MKALLFIVAVASCIALATCGSDPHQGSKANTVVKDDIISDLQQAISDHPDSVRLYDRLIDTLTGRREYKAAADWCNKLIEGADSNYLYWFVKGDIYRMGKMYDSAINAYKTYLRKFPDDEQILLNLANTYAEAADPLCLGLCDRIVARTRTREMRSETAFIKGVYYNEIKQYAEARKWLDTTILLNYKYTEAYMEKGYSYFDEGKYKEALKTFTILTDISSGEADAWYWMAKSNEVLGNKEQAISNYEQAYGLDRNIIEAREAIERLKKQ